MRREGNLLGRIADRDNLVLAFWKAAKGKRETAAVRRYSAQLDEHLDCLHQGIREGTVRVGGYERFVVHDPKRRTIHAAPFEQRVLHHAIMNVCGTVFERGASDSSCACRLGRGNRLALAKARRNARRHKSFLKLDIRRYFDSVDHTVLKSLVRRVIKDGPLLELLDRIVDSYSTAAGKGLPIGTLTSQYFANFYLDPLDRFIQAELRCSSYVRFMDDFALWHDSATQLASWWSGIDTWLRDRLGLELKQGTRIGRTAAGMSFLGFRVLPGRLVMAREARRRFAGRLAALHRALSRGALSQSKFQRQIAALIAHTDPADCLSWRRRVVAPYNSEEFE